MKKVSLIKTIQRPIVLDWFELVIQRMHLNLSEEARNIEISHI